MFSTVKKCSWNNKQGICEIAFSFIIQIKSVTRELKQPGGIISNQLNYLFHFHSFSLCYFNSKTVSQTCSPVTYSNETFTFF